MALSMMEQGISDTLTIIESFMNIVIQHTM